MNVLIDYLRDLNWLAVVVATLAAFVAGFIWYSRGVFGNIWMKTAGLKEKDIKSANMGKSIVIGLVSTFVTATALAVVFDVLALSGALSGALLGVLVAVGFIVANKAMHDAFELKSATYFLVTGAGDIVALAVMGAVLGLFN
jgi:hypothetical protein